MLSIEETNILGSILNDTWGKSSTPVSPTVSIKTSVQGDTMHVKYTTVVYLASDRNLRDQVTKCEQESAKLCSDYVKMIKKNFKDASGRALKVSEKDTNDSVEIITTSPHTPRKTAYYRRFTRYQYE